MANNLKDHLKEVADAIRAKKGTSDLINPQDFATEIEGISGGGSGGGESGYEYFALTDGWVKDLGATFGLLSSAVKTQTSTLGMVILPAEYARIVNNGESIDPVALALDMSLILSTVEQQVTVKELILASGTTEESLAKYRITKEQFYDLNS